MSVSLTRVLVSLLVTSPLGLIGYVLLDENGREWWKKRHQTSFEFVLCQDFLWGTLRDLAGDLCGDFPVREKLDEYLWLASENWHSQQGDSSRRLQSEEQKLVDELGARADFFERLGDDHLVANSQALRSGDDEGEFNVYVGYYVVGEEVNGEWRDTPKRELKKADAVAQYRVMDLRLKFSLVDGTPHLDRWDITRFIDKNFETYTVRIRAVTLDDRKVPKDIFGSYPIPAVVQGASGELLKSRSGEDLLKAPVKHVFCQLPRHAASGDVRERPWVRTTAGWIPREWMHKGVKIIRNAGPPGTVPLEEVRPCEPGSTLYRPTVGVVVDDKRSFPEER